MKHKNLWILVGLPGSGKSYWAQKNKGNAVYISRDAIRFSMLGNDEEYFKYEGKVYSIFLKQIQGSLNRGEDVIADATHLNWASRNKLIEHLYLENVNVNCVVFKTDLETCLERNAMREGRACVPETVIRNMRKSFTHPLSDPYNYHVIKNVYPNGSEEDTYYAGH